ncbi:MAG: hypothetical protein J6X84_01140 [Treponema sp.]|nr:hypothetical protein [Treponema sp.]
MKRILMVLSVISVLSLSAFAQKKVGVSGPVRTEGKWTEISYVNVPVIKVMEAREGYVVYYQKNKVGVGKTVIPKKWVLGSQESPRKLKFCSVKTANESYMTVVTDKGEFKRVILSLPTNKLDSVWGIVDYNTNVEGTDKDTLEDLEL